jgi:two-component system, response regulator RegA
VSFNIGTPDAVRILMRRNVSSNTSAIQTDKPLVLVVDDNEGIRLFVTESLSANGFSCVTAASVAEAISALDTNKPHLIVLDWGLDRCGREVLRVAKKLYPQMPVLVMSGQDSDVLTDAILEEADAFLPKPLSCAVLNKQAAQLIKRDAFLPARPEDILPLEEVKRIYIQRVVALLDNNASLAAEKLQIHRQTVSAALAKTDAPANDAPGIEGSN